MLKRLCIVTLLLMLTGCSTPVSQQVMLIEKNDLNIQLEDKFKNNLYVRSVSGGKETNPLWLSEVDSEAFKGALENSLAALGYRSYNSNSEYIIDVTLKDVKHPFAGLTMDVTSDVAYSVTKKNGAINYFQVSATGSATISDEVIGHYRAKLANGRSIKENIIKFIRAISINLKD